MDTKLINGSHKAVFAQLLIMKLITYITILYSIHSTHPWNYLWCHPQETQTL